MNILDANRNLKQLVILSGKGGTGKTSLSAAFAHLGCTSGDSAPPIMVDADVDAANLSLALKPQASVGNDFLGGSLAKIDPERCAGCGDCVRVCRYDAILPDPHQSQVYWIDPVACDGCAACVYACPHAAINMVQQQEGNWFRSETPFGTLFHAELFPGRENSGKLVTLVKQQARLWAEDTHSGLIIIDGPPGIGCPVISACAGADLGLVVTEPGLAAQHDLKRILGTLRHFRVPPAICVNKADIYAEGTRQIRDFANEEGIPVIAEIPFDEQVPRAMLMGVPITEAYPQAPASCSMRAAWENTVERLFNREERRI